MDRVRKNIDYEIQETIREAEAILKPKAWLLPPLGFGGDRTVSADLRHKLLSLIIRKKPR